MWPFKKTNSEINKVFEDEPYSVLEVPVALGDRVRDVVSGFNGVVTVWGSHLHGCDRLEVDPTEVSEEGKPKDAYIFDVVRLEVLEQAVLKVIPTNPLFNGLMPGAKIKDNITGMEGIVGTRSVSHTGDVFINLEPTTLGKDGAPMKGVQGMAGRFDLIAPATPPVAAQAPLRSKPGGPTECRPARRANR